MIISAPYRDHNPRLAIIGGCVAIGLGMLLIALFRVQVLQSDRYDDRQEAQSLRRIRLPAARGEIVDRNGVVLANNRASYDVAITLDQIGRVSKTQNVVRVAQANVFALASILNLPVTADETVLRNQYMLRRPVPLALWRDLPAPTVAAFAERGGSLPGTDLMVMPVRQYPNGSLAAHLLGYCGRPEQTADDDAENFYYYQPDTVGKSGIERAFDADLRGAPGGRSIRVNPAGIRVGTVGEKQSERGNRVVLTLDAKLQRAVEDALAGVQLRPGKDLRASAVVIDPRNGEILAMASLPGYDPNQSIVPYLTAGGSPMMNRVTQAGYAPGSTFKPVTLLAGLESGKINIHDTADCGGSLRIGNRSFGCWNRQGHGRVDGMTAMLQSCDVWFYQEGMRVGVEAIGRAATELGLGVATGLDYSKDRSGLVPGPDWKWKKHGERWWDGDTAQLAIGQSFLLTTPLQMANVAATFANRGTRYRPFVVKAIVAPDGRVLHETKPQVAGKLSARPQNIELVRQTMLAAIQSPNGTGHRADVKGINVAGKTGTAEFDTPEGRINRAWFIGFAPYEAPTVAVAVCVEDADSGGHTAAPVGGLIFAKVFGKAATGSGGGGD